MNQYDEIRDLIEKTEDVDFAEFGEGVSDEWIEKAEQRLNLTLPDSYKWWLKNYGGGEIYGEEIFSIYEEDFDTVCGGDLVYMHELNQEQSPEFSPNMLVVCESDADDETYYFDTSVTADGNEYPIYALHRKCLYAKDFLDFLRKRMLEE